MKLFYAFIFTISSTTLAFPQPDPINHQPDNIFGLKNENGILTFKKASELVLGKNKLLAENYPDSENGYLVVRDTEAENYFVVSDKAKDKLWSDDLDHIGYVVYNATKYTKGGENGTISIGHPVALKRYLEATCVNTDFPMSVWPVSRISDGDLIKIDTGKMGCFFPMKYIDGYTFLNFIVTGNGPRSGKNASSSINELLHSIEMELNKFSFKGLIKRTANLGSVMIDDSNNIYKVAIIGFVNVKLTAWRSVEPTYIHLNREMLDICNELKEEYTLYNYFTSGLRGLPKSDRIWPDILVGMDYYKLFSEICRKRYESGHDLKSKLSGTRPFDKIPLEIITKMLEYR